MKKIGYGCLTAFITVAVIIVLIILFFSVASDIFSDKVIESLGKPMSKEFYTNGEFQDYTDYGIYQFNDVDLTSNEFFKPIAEADIEEIYSYVDDFERWIDAIKRDTPEADIVDNYNFDSSLIDVNDYFYIDDKCNYDEFYKNIKYANYDVYFFDAEQKILYFFHSNI